MKMMKQIAVITVLTLSMGAVLLPTAFEFAEPGTARTAGMGGASAGLINNADVFLSDPSMLGLKSSPSLSLTHHTRPFYQALEVVSYSHNFSFGNLGAAVKFNHNSFENENVSGAYSAGSELNDMIYDIAGVASYAKNLLGFLNLGLNVKYYRSSAFNYVLQGFAADAGVSTSLNLIFKDIDRPDFTAGIVMKDIGLGPAPTYSDGSEGVPFDMTIMTHVDQYIPPIGASVSLQAEYAFNDELSELPLTLRLGAEFLEDWYVSPRLGVASDFSGIDMSLGASFSLNLQNLRYSIDYAFTASADEFSDFNGGMDFDHVMGVSISRAPLSLIQVQAQRSPFPQRLMYVGDKFSLHSAPEKVDAPKTSKEGGYVIDFKDLEVSKEILEDKEGFDRRLQDLIRSRLNTEKGIILYSEGAKDPVSGKELNAGDVDFKAVARVKSDGELMSYYLDLKDPKSGSRLMGTVFTEELPGAREERPYSKVKAVMRGGKVVLLGQKGDTKNEGFVKQLDSLSSKTGSWISENAPKANSAEVLVKTSYEGVDVFVDGFYKGKIGASKQITLEIEKGKRTLMLSKEGLPLYRTEPILFKAGMKTNIFADFFSENFKTDVRITSFPEGQELSFDGGAEKGSPLVLEMIGNGSHNYTIKSPAGKEYQRSLEISTNAVYNVYEVFEYSDSFGGESINDKFWRVKKTDNGISVAPGSGGLTIDGQTSDAENNGNGLSSPLFEINDTLKVELHLSSSDANGGSCYAGFLDENNEGFTAIMNSEFVSKQVFGTINEFENTVKAAPVTKADADYKINIEYNAGSEEMLLFVNDVEVSRGTFSLSGKVRFVIFADAKQSAMPVKFSVKQVKLENL